MPLGSGAASVHGGRPARPATVADLGITGDRPAGVVAATVAEHLLDTGVALWRTVVIVGEGPWAARVAGRARALGSRIIALGSDAGWADEHLGLAAPLQHRRPGPGPGPAAGLRRHRCG